MFLKGFYYSPSSARSTSHSDSPASVKELKSRDVWNMFRNSTKKTADNNDKKIIVLD